MVQNPFLSVRLLLVVREVPRALAPLVRFGLRFAGFADVPARAASMRAVAARCAALRGFFARGGFGRFCALAGLFLLRLLAASIRAVAAFCAALRGFLRLAMRDG